MLTSLNTNSSKEDLVFYSLKIIGSVIFVIGVPTNLLIICLVSRNRKLKNPTNFFICSLAAADLLVLLWMLLWILSIHSLLEVSTVIKYVIPSFDMSIGVASIVNVACVSVDRAIAVLYPLERKLIMTKLRALLVILALWFYTVVLFVAALSRMFVKLLTFNKVILYLGFISYFIPFIIIALSYTVILLVLVKKLKDMRELEGIVLNNVENPGKSFSDRKKRQRRKLLRELKVTANILLIVVPFTVGWTFFIATHIYEHIHNKTVYNKAHNIAMITVPWLLSGLNPVVYLLFNRPLRRAVVSSTRKMFDTRNSLEEQSFLSSFSRLASTVFRRASEEGIAGQLNVSTILCFNKRESRS